jgi:hypothetical protein
MALLNRSPHAMILQAFPIRNKVIYLLRKTLVGSPKTQPLRNPRRVCQPEKRNPSLGVDVLQWYHPVVMRRKEEKTEKGRASRQGTG